MEDGFETKIPPVCDFHIHDLDVRAKDSELKWKGREYCDIKIERTESDIFFWRQSSFETNTKPWQNDTNFPTRADASGTD